MTWRGERNFERDPLFAVFLCLSPSYKLARTYCIPYYFWQIMAMGLIFISFGFHSQMNFQKKQIVEVSKIFWECKMRRWRSQSRSMHGGPRAWCPRHEQSRVCVRPSHHPPPIAPSTHHPARKQPPSPPRPRLSIHAPLVTTGRLSTHAPLVTVHPNTVGMAMSMLTM